jgi:hypothetical protein
VFDTSSLSISSELFDNPSVAIRSKGERMRMTVQGMNFDLATAILAHVRERLAAGLVPFAPRVRASRCGSAT